MDESKFLYKIDPGVCNPKYNLKAIYFTKPRLVACYEQYGYEVKPANKIFYLKKPNLQIDPIDLVCSNDCKGYVMDIKKRLKHELIYAMSSKYENSVKYMQKIKIFVKRQILVDLMLNYYYKSAHQYTLRVCRYNGDLYITSDLTAGEIGYIKRLFHWHQRLFSESLYYDPPNIKKTCSSSNVFIGVHQSSLGEFELIYSGEVWGIQPDNEIINCDDLEVLNSCRWIMMDYNRPCEKYDQQRFYLSSWLKGYLSHSLDLYIFDHDSSTPKIPRHKRLFELPLENKCHWEPKFCIGFLHELLQQVNTVMSNDDINSLDTGYEFYVGTDNTVTYTIFIRKFGNVVITSEYMDYCKKKQTSN